MSHWYSILTTNMPPKKNNRGSDQKGDNIEKHVVEMLCAIAREPSHTGGYPNLEYVKSSLLIFNRRFEGKQSGSFLCTTTILSRLIHWYDNTYPVDEKSQNKIMVSLLTFIYMESLYTFFDGNKRARFSCLNLKDFSFDRQCFMTIFKKIIQSKLFRTIKSSDQIYSDAIYTLCVLLQNEHGFDGALKAWRAPCSVKMSVRYSRMCPDLLYIIGMTLTRYYNRTMNPTFMAYIVPKSYVCAWETGMFSEGSGLPIHVLISSYCSALGQLGKKFLLTLDSKKTFAKASECLSADEYADAIKITSLIDYEFPSIEHVFKACSIRRIMILMSMYLLIADLCLSCKNCQGQMHNSMKSSYSRIVNFLVKTYCTQTVKDDPNLDNVNVILLIKSFMISGKWEDQLKNILIRSGLDRLRRVSWSINEGTEYDENDTKEKMCRFSSNLIALIKEADKYFPSKDITKEMFERFEKEAKSFL